MINVLQYNPTSNSKIRAPQKQEMVAFKHQLEQTGLEVTMRVSHGREIKAACGQLANTYNKAKNNKNNLIKRARRRADNMQFEILLLSALLILICAPNNHIGAKSELLLVVL